jgi:P4 family phage/plasmid primase-like protien
VGRAPKRLMVFRADVPFSKRASGFFTDALGVDHQLEVLGEGQQFVAYGIHPDTRKPYQWVTMEALHDVRAADLPVLTAAGADAVIAEFVRLAEKRGWVRKSGQSAGNSKDDFWFLRPKPEATDEELEAAMAAFPNPGRDYDLWVKVGAALHDHTAGDERGFSLWDEWSSRSELYNEEMTRKKWTSFGRYTGQPVTIGFILAATRVARAEAEATKATDIYSKLEEKITASESVDDLVKKIAPEIRASGVENYRIEILLRKAQARASKLTGVRVPLKDFKKPEASPNDVAESAGRMVDDIRLEYDLARHVLDDQFSGGKHLKRFSKIWWEYRGGVWRRAEEDTIAKRVMDTVLKLTQENDERLTILFARAAESRGDRMNALVDTLKSVLEKIVAEEGGDDPLNMCASRVPMVLNTLNCELWFEQDGTFEVRDHRAESRLTSQIGCVYDPDAKCPTWEKSLQLIFRGSEEPNEVIRHWEEVIGYALQPTRHIPVCLLMMGPGSNGKTFAMQVASAVAGIDAVASMSLAEIAKGSNTHFADGLQGKLMLLDDDLKEKTLLPDDWLKKLSEDKAITANPKFGRQYSFVSRCLPIILANFAPSTVDLSEGLRRRMTVFESSYVIPEEAKNPLHKTIIMDHELPGVLNRFIAGFQQVLRRGYRFDVPADCLAAKEKWLVSSNPTVLFTREAIERSDGVVVRATLMYDYYLHWAKFNEHNIRGLGRNKFYEALEKLGFRRVNRNGIFYFSDVLLKPIDGLDFVSINE